MTALRARGAEPKGSVMQIQVHADHNVAGASELTSYVENQVLADLHAFADRIVSVDVHVRHESAAGRGGDEVRCLMEARPAGHEPVVTRHHATSAVVAVDEAAREMRSRLQSLFGRLDERHPGADTIRHPPA